MFVKMEGRYYPSGRQLLQRIVSQSSCTVQVTNFLPVLADSRVFGGLHFPSASDDGLAVGRLAAGKVIDRIKPLPGSKAAIRPAEQSAATAAEKGKAVTGRRLRA
jgi:hypothetical protein